MQLPLDLDVCCNMWFSTLHFAWHNACSVSFHRPYISFVLYFLFFYSYILLSLHLFFFTILVLLSYNSMRCILPPPLPLPSSHSINLQSLIYIATNVQVFRIVATLYIYIQYMCVSIVQMYVVYIYVYIYYVYMLGWSLSYYIYKIYAIKHKILQNLSVSPSVF